MNYNSNTNKYVEMNSKEFIYDERNIVFLENRMFEKIDYTCEYTNEHYDYREIFSYNDYDYVEDIITLSKLRNL